MDQKHKQSLSEYMAKVVEKLGVEKDRLTEAKSDACAGEVADQVAAVREVLFAFAVICNIRSKIWTKTPRTKGEKDKKEGLAQGLEQLLKLADSGENSFPRETSGESYLEEASRELWREHLEGPRPAWPQGQAPPAAPVAAAAPAAPPAAPVAPPAAPVAAAAAAPTEALPAAAAERGQPPAQAAADPAAQPAEEPAAAAAMPPAQGGEAAIDLESEMERIMDKTGPQDSEGQERAAKAARFSFEEPGPGVARRDELANQESDLEAASDGQRASTFHQRCMNAFQDDDRAIGRATAARAVQQEDRATDQPRAALPGSASARIATLARKAAADCGDPKVVGTEPRKRGRQAAESRTEEAPTTKPPKRRR